MRYVMGCVLGYEIQPKAGKSTMSCITYGISTNHSDSGDTMYKQQCDFGLSKMSHDFLKHPIS